MTSPATPQHTGTSRRALERRWVPAAAFGFVLLALVALAVAPAVLLHRIVTTTEAIASHVLPTYDALRDLAFATEERVAASRSRFLSDDPRYSAALEAAMAREAGALERLERLAPRFGPRALTHLAEIRRFEARRDSLEDALVAGGPDIEAYRGALPRFDVLRDSLMVEITGLQREVMGGTTRLIRDEVRLASLQRTLSIVLGIAAMLAALLVGWFAWQQMRLRHQIEHALDEANHQREIAERRKDELQRVSESRVRLMRGITHDVKNPLGAARGYADLLEMGVKGPVAPEQRPLVEGIRRSIDGALAIIAELLDLARADSDAVPVHLEEVDLRAVVRQTSEEHRASAEAAGHTLEIALPPGPVPVETDPSRVARILGNLLSNAIKYTPAPGVITVRCAHRQGRRAGEADSVTVHVSDTGPGIPGDQREAIFDEFTRLEDGSPQKGHGLGLAVSRRIARTLGGELVVADGTAPGATFVLSLPAARRHR